MNLANIENHNDTLCSSKTHVKLFSETWYLCKQAFSVNNENLRYSFLAPFGTHVHSKCAFLTYEKDFGMFTINKYITVYPPQLASKLHSKLLDLAMTSNTELGAA